ncbi:MAG: response regulator [Elusimicrobiota bacterium]
MKEKILIVDDSQILVEMLKFNLENKGYIVTFAYNGDEALQYLKKHTPDLVILDIMLPDMNGLDIFNKLRENRKTFFTPVLVISVRDRPSDRIEGLKMGVDDYLTKPFEVEELILRIDALFKKNKLVMSANPLTNLPGNKNIVSELYNRLDKGETISLAYFDIGNLKSYNEKYGYDRGDDVIKFTAGLLKKALSGNDFIGHSGEDDFVLIFNAENDEKICTGIIEEFDRKINSFYDKEDSENGYVTIKTRKGRNKKYSIIRLYAGIVTNKEKDMGHYGEIMAIAKEMNKYAKLHGAGNKSAIKKDKRKE